MFRENRFYLDAFSDDAYEEPDDETLKMRCSLDLEGFRTTKEFAIRAVQWFNGGHPTTYHMPVSVMKDGKVTDTEMIPLNIPNRVMWRSMTLEVHFMICYDKKATVGLAIDSQKHNGGTHGLMMDDVSRVCIADGKLIIAGNERIAEIELVDSPDLLTKKHAPKWFLDEMTTPIGDMVTAADIMPGRLPGFEWLHPMTESVIIESVKTRRQSILEDFA
ncbi:MAG: hypothetical protein E7Z65_06235 [Thermoplasmata archaeon]|nr:hypothetical protein [Thermoplasmata archaeon]